MEAQAQTTELAREIVGMCRGDFGFALAGVCRAEPISRPEALAQWLAEGRHGEMGYLARHADVRLDPRLLLEGAQSIIVVADQYAARNDARESEEIAVTRGRVARYARGDDYHLVIKQRLHRLCDELSRRFPEHGFRSFVDTAPILEREHAARAGLGWIGKNTLLIHPGLGSYVFLAGILTTLELAPPAEQAAVADHCGTCTRCIDACPTGAISPYAVDASRCISYTTIEHRTPIAAELQEGQDDWIYGCDICQEVCPHNSPRPEGAAVGKAHAAYAARNASFDLLEVLGWSEEDRRAAFARSAMKRAKRNMMQRNAVIAAGNALEKGELPAEYAAALRRRLRELADDAGEDAMVRQAAAVVGEKRNLAQSRGGAEGGGE